MTLPENFQFARTFEIGSYQVNPRGELRVRSLVDILQEIAWKHADSGDFGRNLLESQQMWVLSRLEIKIEKMPLWGDTVRVFTGGRGVDKLFAFREFLMQDNDGKVLARAMSSWLLLHTRTKRIQRPEQVLPKGLFDPKFMPNWQPKKIRITGEVVSEEVVRVRYSDLDLYNHVNNTSYIRWIEDLLADKAEGIKFLNINYLMECVSGEEVNLTLYESKNQFFVKGDVKGEIVFASVVSKCI